MLDRLSISARIDPIPGATVPSCHVRMATDESILCAGAPALFEAFPIGVILAEPDGAIREINRTACHLLGVSRAGALGADVGDFAGNAMERRRLRDLVARHVAGAEHEICCRHGDGRDVWLSLSLRRVVLEGAPKILLTVSDVTDQRRQTEELWQARRAAEAGTQARMRFLATMSHEIRTPMNGILGMVRLLDDTDLSDRQRHYVETILNSGETLLTILNDILDFSKLEAGRFAFEHVDFELRAVIGETIDLFRQKAAEKGLVLSCGVAADVAPYLRGDSNRLRQILVNLLSNGIKFTTTGAVHLDVAAVQERLSRPLLRFAVSDTGIGIAPEDRDKLFQEFTQVDASISRIFGGTGLGLAICKRMVSLLGGRIGCDSTPGAGSTFWFELPFEPGLPPEPHTLRAADRPARTLRILLAEDNPVNQEVAMAMLRNFGHTVTLARNGHEAVSALRDGGRFDLVLMDVQMPELDGVRATEAIRALPLRSGTVPILAMTASVFEEDRDRCMAAGMNGFVAKPIDPRRLNRILAELRLPPAEDAAPVEVQPCASGRVECEQLQQLATVLGPDKLLTLLRDYAMAASGMVQAIGRAVANDDVSMVQKIAHDLKSNSGNLGLPLMAEVARRIELAAHDQNRDLIRTAALQLNDHLSETLVNLRRLFPRLPTV